MYKIFRHLLLLSCFNIAAFTTLQAKENDKLIFALDIVRHGDRTPIRNFPNLPHDWPQGLGQLTAKGMQQEFLLGTKLRQRYIEEYHLLPSQYDAKTIYVRSTDYDRTLMSAQSLLQGLYPVGTGPHATDKPALPNGFQPIPIHTMPADEKDVLLVNTDTPKFKQLLEKHVLTRTDWQAKERELKSKYAKWSKATGVEISSLTQVQSLADTLHVNRLYGVALPKGLGNQDADEIIEAGKWVFVTKFKPKEMGQETGKHLLATIFHFLQKADHQNEKLKYVLLVGHDSSILALFSALQIPLDQPPPYAAYVNFSLFERKNGEREIEIRFNDTPVKVSACSKTACTAAELGSLFNEKQTIATI